MEPNYLEMAEFADNPEPRCPVVLVMDTSGSMKGMPIQELNEGLRAFATALKADRLASLRVEVAVVVFGGKVRAIDVRGDPQLEGKDMVVFNPLGLALRKPTREIPFDSRQAFVTVDKFEPPVLAADGGTPMGEAVQRALALLRERKEIYKQNGLDYFRPWMFVISDGKPTDKGWEAAAEQIKQDRQNAGNTPQNTASNPGNSNQNDRSAPLEFYPAGSAGPEGADQLLWRSGRAWRPID